MFFFSIEININLVLSLFVIPWKYVGTVAELWVLLHRVYKLSHDSVTLKLHEITQHYNQFRKNVDFREGKNTTYAKALVR